MTWFAEVVVPGPWWSNLTYRSSLPLEPGTRVRVPVGRGVRVGFVLGGDSISSWPEAQVRPILDVLDERPVISLPIWQLTQWVGRSFLCGVGLALSVMLPGSVLKGEAVPPLQSQKMNERKGRFSVNTCYRWLDDDRLERYKTYLIDPDCRAVVAFPEIERAKAFFKDLERSGISGGLLWPRGNGTTRRKAWLACRDGLVRFVVGGPGVMAAPLCPDVVIIEEESNDAYRLQRHPKLHARSVLSRMAREWGAELLLGGRLPSSRVMREIAPKEERRKPGARLVLIDVNRAHEAAIDGASDGLHLSEGALSRTVETVSRGGVALWLLDRKSYLGDLRCDDCGRPLQCLCGGSMGLRHGRVRCLRCGREESWSDVCPCCGGAVITGRRPGLEALVPIAQAVVSGKTMLLWTAEDPRGIAQRRERIKALKEGGLVLGTRRALELCDLSIVDLVCWIDGDGESWRPDHDARWRAYSIVCESCWRGHNPENRTVLLQSRRPGKGWQSALRLGWEAFWKNELAERRELELPPYRYLVEITDLADHKANLAAEAAGTSLDVMDPDPGEDRLWVATPGLGRLRNVMASRFAIGSKVYPKVTVWTD
ncbi:MAG: hypothetical protein CSA35_00990 [Dethiosulfovibrio peptidovorans]|nr:MAG: hypothetical protein CSA35_00990 [Dethiosulfovibrio peptidovorans]